MMRLAPLLVVAATALAVLPTASAAVAGDREVSRLTSFGGACKSCELAGRNMSNARITGANFSGANLTGASLRDARLFASNFTGANLTKADLRDSTISGTSFAGANLRDFGPELI